MPEKKSKPKSLEELLAEGATVGKLARHLGIGLEEARHRFRSQECKYTFPDSRPLNSEEAREWLEDVAGYLSGENRTPIKADRFRVNGATRRRFIGRALHEWLHGNRKDVQSLASLLGLDPPKPSRGRPSLSSEKVTAISKMLIEKAPHTAIAKAVGVGKKTVDRISEYWNALAWQAKDTDSFRDLAEVPADRLSPVRKRDLEKYTEDFEAASKKVPQDKRAAIISGVADAIRPTILDLFDLFPDADNRGLEERAWFMAATGYSVEQIAEELELSSTQVCQFVQKARLNRHR